MSTRANRPGFIEPIQGTVLAVQANFYRVRLQLADSVDGVGLPPRELLCTRRSRLKKMGQQVMVGDQVRIEEPDWQGGRGAIAEVLPRGLVLQRPPVANAQQVLLLFALVDPPLDLQQLTRFLVTVEATGLQVRLCFNKCDLVDQTEQQDWCDRVHQWGYPAHLISLYQQRGLEGIQTSLKHRVTVLAGPSGVGKSSLIHHLLPHAELRVGEISHRWRRGQHTTRHVELFELPQGGLIADTPGFNQPALTCEPSALAHCFPEIRQRLQQGQCQFKDCLHRDEPHCMVRGSWERYPYYLTLLEEAMTLEAERNATANPEVNLKTKPTRGGSTHPEPKLMAKRYRRSARKTEHQTLQHLYQEAEEQWSSPER
ncbi:small ribosomal subunit biogenesis GTPase RsgA [Synechococcales cyanobacterium C]|uniref:Small ribosomal subunit biogenesis GTPase RsgA n=1 Tax=Petrachloros mirabilis ULC683 TaxID=2781853 RepID=A0A8K2A6Z6_9CYAN|nr:small ribosomal subunit biogenesis GTPase RsgA [Petrachloros mirabilis ULC683]